MSNYYGIPGRALSGDWTAGPLASKGAGHPACHDRRHTGASAGGPWYRAIGPDASKVLWLCDCGGTIEIDPCRPEAEKDLLKSGAVFWFETFDTVVDGTTCVINGIDGYPGSIYATEAEVVAELASESCHKTLDARWDVSSDSPLQEELLDRHGSCHCLDCDDERGYSNSADYLHNRKAFWHPAGGWIDGERLPVPQDARE